MEIGARALGNRSILANPSFKNMKDKINKDVKRREKFRPFAPSIIDKFAKKWIKLDNHGDIYETHRWMIQAAFAKKIMIKNAPSVVHYDESVRPQIVSKIDNPLYYNLLNKFMNIVKYLCF